MTAEPETGGRTVWFPHFVACSMIWGSGFALIKIGVDAGIEPAWVAFWRCSLGALVLWLIVLAGRLELPRDPKVWGHALVVGTVLNAFPFTLFALGEQYISSLLAGVWNAMIPLFTLLWVMLILPEEKPTPRRLLGLAVGFAGALVVLGVWAGVGGGTLTGSVAILVAVASYGLGYTYTRKYLSDVKAPVLTLTALQLGLAALELAIVAPLLDGPIGWYGVGPMSAMLVLGAVGTGIAFMWNMRVIRAVGSTVASTVAYLTPLWAAIVGVLFLKETLEWNTVVGALLIIGAALLIRPPSRPASAGANEQGDSSTPVIGTRTD